MKGGRDVKDGRDARDGKAAKNVGVWKMEEMRRMEGVCTGASLAVIAPSGLANKQSIYATPANSIRSVGVIVTGYQCLSLGR
ncbi:MAG: hypothetical protein D5R99_08815 [Methanocalculus sp. MSAO_Arc1]|nr:MAG: hypothetical protein D5R99_08815 [Methanocalculus sp. MSAO_Arc1]